MLERLAPLDVNFWSLDSELTPQVIATYCILEHAPELRSVREAVAEQVEVFSRFRQRIIWRHGWRWEAYSNFRIEEHVKHLVVPEICDRAALDRASEAHFASPLRHDISPWDFCLISGCDPKGPAAVMFRVHHALADGLGGFEFFHRICSVEQVKEHEQSQRSGGDASSKTVKAPPRFGLRFWRSLKRLWSETREGSKPSLLNGKNSNKRELRYIDIAIVDLRTARKKVGASVNDILLSLVAGAFRRYQLSKGGSPHNVRALIPFSLRRKKHAMALGNHITGVALELPVNNESPIARAHHVRAGMNRLKLDGSFGAFRILGLINGYLPDKLRKTIGRKAARRTNLICTNMPGPEKSLYLVDAKILANYGCAALLCGHGVAFSFITYAGQMHISFVSDPGIVPDPDQFLSYFSDCWEELRSVAPERNPAKKTPISIAA